MRGSGAAHELPTLSLRGSVSDCGNLIQGRLPRRKLFAMTEKIAAIIHLVKSTFNQMNNTPLF
jgi:hypothetical protein